MNEKYRWIGPYPIKNRYADDVTVEEMVRLRKLTTKYKDALEQIVKSQYNADSKDIANKALENDK